MEDSLEPPSSPATSAQYPTITDSLNLPLNLTSNFTPKNTRFNPNQIQSKLQTTNPRSPISLPDPFSLPDHNPLLEPYLKSIQMIAELSEVIKNNIPRHITQSQSHCLQRTNTEDVVLQKMATSDKEDNRVQHKALNTNSARETTDIQSTSHMATDHQGQQAKEATDREGTPHSQMAANNEEQQPLSKEDQMSNPNMTNPGLTTAAGNGVEEIAAVTAVWSRLNKNTPSLTTTAGSVDEESAPSADKNTENGTAVDNRKEVTAPQPNLPTSKDRRRYRFRMIFYKHSLSKPYTVLYLLFCKTNFHNSDLEYRSRTVLITTERSSSGWSEGFNKQVTGLGRSILKHYPYYKLYSLQFRLF